MIFYKYRVEYNINFWGSRKASGYGFAESIEDAKTKLENRYGKVNYNDLEQSTVVGFRIEETDFIDMPI